MSTTKAQRVAEEVEKTLHAFDHDDILEENPFLVSRVKAEMNSRSVKRHEGFLLRMNVKYVVMVLILLVNLMTIVHYVEWNSTHNLHEKLISELQEDFQIDQSQSAF